jgi:hypothetical protein
MTFSDNACEGVPVSGAAGRIQYTCQLHGTMEVMTETAWLDQDTPVPDTAIYIY